MTYKNDDRPTKAVARTRAPLPEIEITPEMIEAGKSVVTGPYLSALEAEDLVELVYRAMRPLERAPEDAAGAKTARPA
jgi:hypothetical protein